MSAEAVYGMRGTVLFNPYTGTPRHPFDIQSDPHGRAIVEPDEPLHAASPPAAAPELSERDLMRVFWQCKPDERAQRALTYTQWKNSIDVQVPTLFLRDFARAILDAAISKESP